MRITQISDNKKRFQEFMLQSGRKCVVLTVEICLMASLPGGRLRAADGSNVESRLNFFRPAASRADAPEVHRIHH